jgi:hypothetical protein
MRCGGSNPVLLLENWQRAVSQEPLEPIAPLEYEVPNAFRKEREVFA